MAIKAPPLYGQQGMTLIELMIAMVFSSFVIAAIVMAFRSQETSSLVQETVTAMQQNNAAAMNIMTRELRMAGYDLTESGIPGFTTASSSLINFTADLNDDGDVSDTNENISYGFKITADPSDTFPDDDDSDRNGIANAGVADLRRDTGGGMQSMAEGIQAFNFAYAYDANGDGILDQYTIPVGNPNAGQQRTIWAFDSGGIWYDLDTNSDGDLDALDDTNGDGVIDGRNTTTTSSVSDVRAVRIWILARSNRKDSKLTDTNTYVVGRRVLIPNDRFYRRLLTTTVTCRNMGL